MDKTDETWTYTLNYVTIKAGNQSTSPKVFPKTLPQSGCIIDCTEVFIETP